MRQGNRLAQARAEGSLKAARELRRLQVNQTQAIDIFRIIRDENIWLLFQPLDNLLGAYSRAGSGGILITTRHRLLSVQRLTAAHEYGHHVLNHTGNVDDADNIVNPDAVKEVEEAAAQAFATDFLMPPQLVNYLWDELHVPSNVRAYHAYLLSLFMGTSYQATVYQLVAQKKISVYMGRQFLLTSPKQIKREIGRGVGPFDSWAEIWPVDGTFSGRNLTIRVQDEISISVNENPSTGYVWVNKSPHLIDLREEEARIEGDIERDALVRLDSYDNQPCAALLRSAYDPVTSDQGSDEVGGNGHRYITLRALKQTRDWPILLELRRPWRKNSEPAMRFTMSVRIQAKQTDEDGRGYLEETKNEDLALPSRVD